MLTSARQATALRDEIFAKAVIAGKTLEAAAIHVGLSPKTARAQGSRLAGKPRVKQLIEAERARLAKKREISPEKIMDELAAIGFASMDRYMTLDENGDPHLDLKKSDEVDWKAISELQTETYMDGRGENAREVKKVKFKLHAKREALIDLAKMAGYIVTGPGNSGDGAIDITPAEDMNEAARRVAFVLASGRRSGPKVIEQAPAAPTIEDG